MDSNISSHDWSAWHDFMPGSPPTLHVTGKVNCPTSGYKASLVPHTPQGINPAIYLLDLVVVPPGPDEVVTEAFTDIDVHYHEDTRKHYDQVTILPEDITVDVKITH